MATETFEDLKIWQEARRLTDTVYAITRQPSFMNDFGFINQIRRAMIEISSKIAEGYERGGNREFSQSLATAKGYAGEVRSQLYLAMDRGYIEKEKGETLINEFKTLSRMIAGFTKYLKTADTKGTTQKPRPENKGA
ncbi:MAG: hypothetical protein H6Q52_2776 [Deltaproteobacteria bacterium]|nr:hypothetical protein [Deltaproteobacteria bacterium]